MGQFREIFRVFYLRVLFWSGVLIEGSIWCDESGRRICFRPFGRVFRFIGFLKPSTGSVLESAEPGFGHDRTTFGSTGDDRDGPTGILHRWKSVINSSRPLKVFLWILKMLQNFLNTAGVMKCPRKHLKDIFFTWWHMHFFEMPQNRRISFSVPFLF